MPHVLIFIYNKHQTVAVGSVSKTKNSGHRCIMHRIWKLQQKYFSFFTSYIKWTHAGCVAGGREVRLQELHLSAKRVVRQVAARGRIMLCCEGGFAFILQPFL